jgi:endo-1,4-beta-xylanase
MKKIVVLMIICSFLISSLVQPTILFADGATGKVVIAQDFENGEVGSWVSRSWGGTSVVSVATDPSDANNKVLKVSERSARGSVPFINLTSLGVKKEFKISFKVKIAEGSDTYRLVAKTNVAGTENYDWTVGNKAVNTDWTVFESKNIQIAEGNSEFLLWLEADGDAGETSEIYIDDFQVVDITPVITSEVTRVSQDFENGEVGSWVSRSWGGTSVVSVATDPSDANNKVLKVSERSARGSVPFINLTSLGVKKEFKISFKVKIAEGSDTYRLVAKTNVAGTENYDWTVGNKAVNTDWTVFESKNIQIAEGNSEFLLWLEADGDAGETSEIYIDDFKVVEISAAQEESDGRPEPKIFTTITFENNEEDQFAGFVPRGGTEILTITNEANHTDGGTKALKIENRSQAWHAPSLRVEEYIKRGLEYKVTAWVKLLSPASSQLQLSTQVGNGDGASYNNIQGQTITAEQGWVKFEGNYRYSSVGDEYVTIYVESSNNASAVYLIDDISFVPTSSGKVEIQKDLQPLKELYKDYFLIGNIVSSKDFEGARLELLKKHFNVATAENAMKPVYAYSTYPTFDFTAENQLATQVANAGLALHGHVMVWHQQSAEELHTGSDGQPLPKSEALANLRKHVKTVAENFADDVISWDVVNEAMNDSMENPSDWRGSLRQSGWLKAIGPDYIKEAFLAAKEALVGKNIKLYYNDYNDDNQNKAEAIYQMVKEINAEYAQENDEELLIDGIGMQAHYNLNTNPLNVEKSLKKFIEVTNEVSVTELDITAGDNNVMTDKQEKQQAYLYAQLFKLYKQYSEHIARVTLWGLDDATSWRAAQNPLIFDADLQAKQAYYAILDPEAYVLANAPEEKIAKEAKASFGTPVIDGSIDSMWNTAAEMKIDTYQTAWQGATGVAKALWDDNNLYVLVQVNDAQLDKASANPWEEDSVEIFLDQNNAKSSSYEDDDGQYRVNFDNEATFSSTRISTGFSSATVITGTNYVLEVKIPLSSIEPIANMKLGFDVQINDAKDGARQSVAAWNDTSGTGYMDPSVFGVLVLEKIVTETPQNPNPPTSGSTPVVTPPTTTVVQPPVEQPVVVEEVITETPVPQESSNIDQNEAEDEVEDEVLPLDTTEGQTLPDTSGIPASLFHLLGLSVSGLGLFMKKKVK